jgi:1-acyl-sn-glycerol-3-phosphate acyltransferase
MIIQAIRSLLFYLLFLGQTVVLAILLGIVALFVPKGRPAPRFMWALGRYWGRANLAFLRFVAGIKSDVQGAENIPAGACIIAAKHQSDWDILAILPHTPLPAFIAKRELLDIPFFGWAAKALNTISVDRKLGSEAIPAMLADATEKLGHDSQIIIFSEGTRRPPLAPPEYRFGTTRLYQALNVPVVPVALNSGLFWGRNSLVLWPGTARARFLPAIPPGLPPEEFQLRLIGAIETASNELALAAYRDGLSRPIPTDLREKFTALEATVNQPARTTTY